MKRMDPNDDIQFEFGINDEFKETQGVEVEEAQQVKLMFTEGEEEEDDELLDVQEGMQLGMDEEPPETKRSVINGGENDELIMDGEEETENGPPQ